MQIFFVNRYNFQPLLTLNAQTTHGPPPQLPPKHVSPPLDSADAGQTDLSPCKSGDSGLQSPTPRNVTAPQKTDNTYSEEQSSPLV